MGETRMGPRLREGRATARALRTGVRAQPTEEFAGRGDPELLALVRDPFADVADAHDRLHELETVLREREDGRGPFLTVYARVTEAVSRGIEERAFEDPEWVAAYLVTFAEHYRRAFAAYERGDLGAVPDAWQLAFDRALSAETMVLQDVLLGVNAHVNYDLALALDDVGIDPDRPRKRVDHRTINETLARLVDEEQALLAERYAEGIADLDAAFGRLDESVSAFALRQGRGLAWRGAVALSLVRGSRSRGAVRWFLNTVSLGVGHTILSPGASRTLLDRLRAVERGESGTESE